MSIRDIVELVLACLLVANLLAMGLAVSVLLRRLARATDAAQAAVAAARSETVATLQSTHEALSKMAELTTSLDLLLRNEVAPTIQMSRAAVGNVEAATRAVSDSILGVKRIIGAVDGVSSPASLVASAVRLAETPTGRAGLIAAVVATAARVAMARRK